MSFLGQSSHLATCETFSFVNLDDWTIPAVPKTDAYPPLEVYALAVLAVTYYIHASQYLAVFDSLQVRPDVRSVKFSYRRPTDSQSSSLDAVDGIDRQLLLDRTTFGWISLSLHAYRPSVQSGVGVGVDTDIFFQEVVISHSRCHNLRQQDSTCPEFDLFDRVADRYLVL